MRKILTRGVVVFAGFVCAPWPLPRPAQTQASPEHRRDPRLEAIRSFFHEAGCPAARYSHAFVEAADNYDLDWRLLPSLSYVESTGGKAAPNNNLFGWDSGRAEFSSPAAAIHAVAHSLARSSLYRDKSLDEKLAIYNPNNDYGRKVKSVMRRISPHR